VLYDSLQLVGYQDPSPPYTRGSVDFKLYSNADCTLQVGSTQTETVDAQGRASTSNGILVTSPGTYYWRVFFKGDQYNGAVDTVCGQETTTIQAVDDRP
jgi:hypothetical protein